MNGPRRAPGFAMLAGAALALAGCGGSGGDDGSTGHVSFLMTDAPVDEAAAVVIAMTEFELKPADGPPFRVPVTEAGRALNLLDFTNGNSAVIIDDEEVPAGQYQWLRIHFDEEASYIQLEADGAQYRLFMPSGAQTGYQLVGGFTVPANGSVEYILDFNVRHSVIEPPGLSSPFGEDRMFLLKPTVRMMNAAETGGVQGVVAAELLDENDPAECEGGNAVYAFEGIDADPLAALPVVSDVVDFNIGNGAHEYHLMYLLPGPYTLAFTCSATLDTEGLEAYPPDGLAFSEQINVEVVAEQVKVCDIPPGDQQPDPC